MNRAYLLLGSNSGLRTDFLDRARAACAARLGQTEAVSPIYETAAWGKTDQASFLNQALCVATELAPKALLDAVLDIEQVLGRQRLEKWGERTIDIDILLYGNIVLDVPELQIPHPFLHERRFALQPLADIAAEIVHPVFNVTIEELLRVCPDTLPVQRFTVS